MNTEPQSPAPVASSKVDRIAALEERVAELEASAAEQHDTESEPVEDRRLSAWGFFDFTYGRVFLDDSRGVYGLGTMNKWSFVSSGINLYLKSEMTKTLSALIETRLTFTPIGTQPDSAHATNVYIAGNYTQTVGASERNQTSIRGPYNASLYHQHGLVIERAYLDWKPADWIGARLGYYLTPFGIWNEDHGSPAILGVEVPSLIDFGLVPIQQLGIQLFGSRQLSDELALEYAATLSNGRGPVAEYKDLDDNKAVGLRAKLVYSTDDWLLRIGGYAYHGRYTDTESQVELYLTPSLTLDTTVSAPFRGRRVTKVAYMETAGMLDAILQYKRFRLTGELAHRKVVYDTAPELDGSSALLNHVPFGTAVHAAAYTGIAYYAVAAYEIQLGESLGNVSVTPYVGADHIAPDQTSPQSNVDKFRAGLNVKPSPYVTNKAEVGRVIPASGELGSEHTAFYLQTAVAF